MTAVWLISWVEPILVLTALWRLWGSPETWLWWAMAALLIPGWWISRRTGRDPDAARAEGRRWLLLLSPIGTGLRIVNIGLAFYAHSIA